MRIAVKAHPNQKAEWLTKPVSENVEVIWVATEVPSADAYFDLTFDECDAAFPDVKEQPVFVNAVIPTLDELPGNCSRLNAWNGFIKRDTIEVVLRDDKARKILDTLGWKYLPVPDQPGMISIRTISMIINEAYFAFGEGVSTKEDIDIAMKLGTNYPFGPFEWSKIIGLHNIYRLLKKFSATDNRFHPAPALEQELKEIA